MSPEEQNANPLAGTTPDPNTTVPDPAATVPAAPAPDPAAAVPLAAPEPSIPPISDPAPAVTAAPQPAMAPEPSIPPIADPLAPAAPAPASPVDPLAGIPASDPLAPATNTPDGQAMLDQALGTSPDSYNVDPLAGMPMPEPAAAPAPADPMATDSMAPATDPLGTPAVDPAAAPMTDPNAAPAAPSFVNDPSVAAAPERSADDQAPIQAAAPVPGSIGSSVSYADHQAAQAAQGDGKKKPKTTMILIIVVAALVLIGGGVFAYIMLTSNNNAGNKNAETPQPTPVAADPVETTLVCTASREDDLEIAGAGATSWNEEVTINYEDDDIQKITDISTVAYDSKENASAGINIFKDYYATLLEGAGLQSDPFDSRYARTDSTLVITYTGTGSRIDGTNAVIFDLPVDEDGELDAGVDNTKDAYKKRGFSCVEK